MCASVVVLPTPDALYWVADNVTPPVVYETLNLSTSSSTDWPSVSIVSVPYAIDKSSDTV